jgi:hypothetical protein
MSAYVGEVPSLLPINHVARENSYNPNNAFIALFSTLPNPKSSQLCDAAPYFRFDRVKALVTNHPRPCGGEHFITIGGVDFLMGFIATTAAFAVFVFAAGLFLPVFSVET